MNEITKLPDGSAFTVAELSLPLNHWLYSQENNIPPMPYKMGVVDPRRSEMVQNIRKATKYALRVSTMNGQTDYDPDAVVQNMVIAMVGYFTLDGNEL